MSAGPYDPELRSTLVDPYFASFDLCVEDLTRCRDRSESALE